MPTKDVWKNLGVTWPSKCYHLMVIYVLLSYRQWLMILMWVWAFLWTINDAGCLHKFNLQFKTEITDLSEYVVMIHEIYSAVVGDQKLPQLLPSEPSNKSVEDIGRGIMRPNDSVDNAYSCKLCPQ